MNSNDPFVGPSLHPGDRFIVRALDGTEHEDTAHSVYHTSAQD